jgi:hypothetical protein
MSRFTDSSPAIVAVLDAIFHVSEMSAQLDRTRDSLPDGEDSPFVIESDPYVLA